MRFFGTTVVKYAVVETDVYVFRVDNSGVTNRWCSDTCDWVWFEREEFTEEELAEVQYQGMSAMALESH
jgi:hypothetical protein